MTKILLVEDQEDGRSMLAEFLTLAGFSVETAENGLEALEIARRERPELVLMDLAMPVLDGWAATRALKGDPATASLPVWALTAYSDPRAARRAREAGCSEVVVKPVEPRELVRLIRELDTTRGLWRASPTLPAPPLASEVSGGEPFPRSAAKTAPRNGSS